MVDRILDNSKVLEFTGLTTGDLTDVREALPRELSAYLSHGPHLSASPTVQGRLDRVSGSSLPFRDTLSEFGVSGSLKYLAAIFGLV